MSGNARRSLNYTTGLRNGSTTNPILLEHSKWLAVCPVGGFSEDRALPLALCRASLLAVIRSNLIRIISIISRPAQRTICRN
jgi:hypothetical protein